MFILLWILFLLNLVNQFIGLLIEGLVIIGWILNGFIHVFFIKNGNVIDEFI